jgi:hypothetical protein
MKILIIEDDENKLTDIQGKVDEIFETLNIKITVTVKHSFQSGLHDVISNKYDLLLLDMSLPNFEEKNDAGVPFGLAGEIILNEMDFYNINTKTIIVTQYEDIEGKSINQISSELESEFGTFYFGYVKYTANELNWQNELENKIKETINR